MLHRRYALCVLIAAMGSAVPAAGQLENETGRILTFDTTCVLTITSDPDSAAVYVGDTLRGRTPLTLRGLWPGMHRVKVSRRDYAPWEKSVVVTPGKPVALMAKLTPNFGTLTLESSQPDAEFFVNGELVSRGTLRDQVFPSGVYEVTAKNSASGVLVSDRIFVAPGSSTRIGANFDKPTLMPLAESILLPGLGQSTSGSGIKGALFIAGFAACVAATMLTSSSYSSKLDNLRDARSAYASATNPDQALSLGKIMMSTQDEVHAAYRTRNIAIGSTVGVYVLSLADIFLHHMKMDEIITLQGSLSPAANSAPGSLCRLQVMIGGGRP